MMGPRQEAQGALFYKFRLDNQFLADHLLRSIDRFVDLSPVPAHLAPFYSSIGRPSLDQHHDYGELTELDRKVGEGFVHVALHAPASAN